jgi:hypothetical protein
MGAPKYVRVIAPRSQCAELDALIAPVAHAYNPILSAVAQQATKKVITFLLGSLPEV